MSRGLDDKDWDTLLRRIADGKCTPFLGAGSCAGILPTGTELATEMAQEFHYPLNDKNDLARVTQFIAVDRDDFMFPKDYLRERFRDCPQPDFKNPTQPHKVLAELPLPIYMTTNYDDYMSDALSTLRKEPQVEICRWNEYLRDHESVFEKQPGFEPTAATPVVFHLHGRFKEPESMVLTEDDYLAFLVNISRDQAILPPRLQRALTGASLLFVGYRLADWNFRVLFQGLVSSMESSLRRISVAVQLPEPANSDQEQQVENYLTKYFKNIKIKVYWGTAEEFVGELSNRWRTFHNGG